MKKSMKNDYEKYKLSVKLATQSTIAPTQIGTNLNYRAVWRVSTAQLC